LALAPQAPQPALREATIAAIPEVIAAGARWTRAWQGSDNADGLVGTPEGGVLFAQEQPHRVLKLDANDAVSVHVENTHGAGSLALDAKGRLIAVERTCTDPGLTQPCAEPPRVAVIFPAADRKVLADSFQGKPLGRLNDLVVDRNGGVYFTAGGAFYASPRAVVSSVGENLRANGIMLSPDETILYVTNGAGIAAFDVQPDGTVRNQRNFATLEAGGSGDGMAVDSVGRLYVTSAPGVQIFNPQGKYLGLIPTPRSAISVAFSGPDKKTLYVVCTGALDADGKDMTTPPGVRNNAKSIFKIRLLAPGFGGRAK
jgi:gluconolactonase